MGIDQNLRASVNSPLHRGRNNNYRLACSIGLTALALTFLTVSGWIPTGVPGEWTWPLSELEWDLPFGLVFVALAASGMILVLVRGFRRIENCSIWERRGWLALLVSAMFAWLWTVQEIAPQPFRLSKAPFVLYFRGSSGYFQEAKQNARKLQPFLKNYVHEQATTRDVLHLGTHPPGLIVLFRGLIGAFESSPGLVRVVNFTTPSSVREAFDAIPRPPPASDRAVLWSAFLLVQLAACLTLLPLWGLIRLDFDRRSAWLACSFWCLVPALPIFLPKSDVLFALFSVTGMWLWVRGYREASIISCGLSALVFWLAMGLSLAIIPVGFCAFLYSLIATFWLPTIPHPRKSWLAGLGGGVFVYGLMTWLVWWGTGLNLLSSWLWCYRNHAGFYDQYPRSYFSWLMVNPLEFATACGLIPFVLACQGIVEIFRDRAQRNRTAALLVSCCVTWTCLWMSGKNQGEAARLWILLIPGVIYASTNTIKGAVENSNTKGVPPVWLTLFVLQGLITVILGSKITGFEVPVLSE